MNLKAVIVAPGLWGLNKSDFRKIGSAAIEAAGLYWHAHFKALHFQKEAFQRYGYKPRSKKWEAEKARVHPEAAGRPLVFSGESEQLAMAQNRVRATAKNFETYSAEVTVSAPNLNYHAEEMTRTTDAELEALAAEFARVFESGMVAAAKDNGVSAGRIELWQGQAA